MFRCRGICAYVVLTTLLIVADSKAWSDPFSDNFSGKKLNPGWIVSSPNADSSVALSGTGYLEMTASPKNGGSDLWPASNYNAPVLLQPISTSENWTVTTELTLARSNQFQGAGILLAVQPGSFTASSQFWRAIELQYQTANGSDGPVLCVEGLTACITYTADTVFMRLTKKGNHYTGAWSSDGQHWSRAKANTVDTDYSYIGLDSLRQPWDGNLSVYSVAEYNYFHLKLRP